MTPRFGCPFHVSGLVLFNVIPCGFWEINFSGIVIFKQISFDHITHQQYFEEILNPPPYHAVDPDIHGEDVGFVVRETHRHDVIDFGIGPSNGQDGGAGQGNAASAQEHSCGCSVVERVVAGS